MTPRVDLFRTIIGRLLRIFFPLQMHTEPAPARVHTRSIFIRHLDAGSSNDNEIEVNALLSPPYDLEHYGRRIVASPRHADLLLVSLPLTRNMVEPARLTWEAMPELRRALFIGDPGMEQSVFAGSYAIARPRQVFGEEEYQRVVVRDAAGREMFPPPARELLRCLLEL